VTVIELRISNSTSGTVEFYLEPWGGRFRVESHRMVRVVVEASSSPVLQWEITEDIQTLVVRDPPGALATVFDGEKELQAE
jgi:hypothetical protein